MNGIKYFDMHCDTLSRCYDEKKDIYDNDFQISLKRLAEYDTAVQFFAAYINTFDYVGKAAYDRFCQQLSVYKKAVEYAKELPNVHPILTIESLSCLNHDIDKIDEFKKCGVKVASLNWNGYNGIAGGIGADEGVSDFGCEVIKALESENIVLDVSHLNDRSFDDVLKMSGKPFIATHSNAREYGNVPRNLTSKQLCALFERGGIVGLNLYDEFLGERLPEYDDLARHIEIMLNSGGEGKIALGTDFDGCDTDERFENVSMMSGFYEYLKAHYGEKFANGIFFDNAADFFADLF